MRRALCVLVLPLLAALGGCGKSDVDRAQLEVQVQRSLEQQNNPALQSPQVSCPDKVRAEKGQQTTCTVTTKDGRTVGALVTITGTADNRVQFDLKLDADPATASR